MNSTSSKTKVFLKYRYFLLSVLRSLFQKKIYLIPHPIFENHFLPITKNVFFVFCVFWGEGLHVLTSINPKPRSWRPSTASACLSNPAAIPTGFPNCLQENSQISTRVKKSLYQQPYRAQHSFGSISKQVLKSKNSLQNSSKKSVDGARSEETF